MGKAHPGHTPHKGEKARRAARQALVPDFVGQPMKAGGIFGPGEKDEATSRMHGAQKSQTGFGLRSRLKQDDKYGADSTPHIVRHERV